MQDNDIEIRPLIDAKPRGLIDRVKQFFVDRKVTVVPSASEPNDIANLIEIVQEGEPLSDFIDQIQIIPESVEVGIEPAMRLAVTAQNNIEAAQGFMTSLRNGMGEILGERSWVDSEKYKHGEAFWSVDLINLSERWSIPMVVIERGFHWLLLLQSPNQNGRQNRALVYDPLIGLEDWIEIPGWDGGLTQENFDANHVVVNSLAREQLRDGSYNLSLFGDAEIASNRQLFEAKSTRVQYDSLNCGPACLFMAAIREGLKPGATVFKSLGREQLHLDTGLEVGTREEVLLALDSQQ